MTTLFGKYFKISFVVLLFFEIFSLLGYLFPVVNIAVFFVLLAATLVLSLKKLEYGVLMLLAELFVGSKGYLFSLPLEGLTVSIRIAMFLTVMALWLTQFFRKRDARIFHSKFTVPFFLLFAAIAWGAAIGFFRNDFQNMFFDMNGWIFFALLFPMFDTIISKKEIGHLLEVLAASMASLALKTFFLLYVFSHQMYDLMYAIYRWVRDTGVGEITAFTPFFSRVFIQSHIYALILLFLASALLIREWKKREDEKQSLFSRFRNPRNILLALTFICTSAIMILSFSRSFWIGGFFGLLLFFSLLIFSFHRRVVFLFRSSIFFFFLILLSFGLVYGIGNFPYPKIDGGFNTSLLKDRFASFSGEAAVVSRWNLLPVLWSEIKKAPLFGSGFGATATYVSKDPRVLETNPSGAFTTFAFEWGYLDMWLKFGFLGLALYGFLLAKIWRNGYALMKIATDGEEQYLLLGLLAGFAALLGTHFFSPYLNHPLGIGFIILLAAIFQTLQDEKHAPTASG